MPEPFVTRASGKTKVLHLATRRSQVIVLQPPSWIDVCCFVCFYCAVSADMLDAPRLPCSPFTRSSPMQKDGFQIITLWMRSLGMCPRRSQFSSASISCLKGWLGKQTFLLDTLLFRTSVHFEGLINIDFKLGKSSLLCHFYYRYFGGIQLVKMLLVTCADLTPLRMIRKLLIILSFRRGKHRATSTNRRKRHQLS